MSGFLSPKYLKFREASAKGRIDEDLSCRSCGYNLRGLDFGRNCPECGTLNDLTEVIHDLLLASGTAERARWRRGLGLASACVGVAMVARMAYFIIGAPGPTAMLNATYVGVGAVNSILWIVAVWMVTPESLLRWSWMRPARKAARFLALMWLVGYACLIARYALPLTVPPVVEFGDVLGRLLGGIGVLFVAFILQFVATEAELPKAARRLNAAIWILWFPTVIAQVFPTAVAWFTLIIIGIVLLFWCWVMTLLMLGLHELYQHVRWAERIAIDSMGRETRMQQTREELDREVEATIRPLPEREE